MPIQRIKPVKQECLTDDRRDYYEKRRRRLETAKRRKEEIKQENFENFLAEESAKCVLGYNPYQE